MASLESVRNIDDDLPICPHCLLPTRAKEQLLHRHCEIQHTRKSNSSDAKEPLRKKRKREEATSNTLLDSSQNDLFTPPQSQLGRQVVSPPTPHELPQFENPFELPGIVALDYTLIILKYTTSRIPFHPTIPELLRPSLIHIVNLLLSAYLSTEQQIYATILLIFPRIFLYSEPPPSDADNETAVINSLHPLLSRLSKISTMEDILEHTKKWLQRDFSFAALTSPSPTQESVNRRMQKLAANDRIFTIRRLVSNKCKPVLMPTSADVAEIQSILDTTTPLPPSTLFSPCTLKPTSIITPRRILRALSALNKAAAPGLSGWNHHLISTLLAARPNIELFSAFLSRIAMGQTTEAITKILTSFHLFPLHQIAKNKIRPVCMGEHLLKLLSKILWAKIMEDAKSRKDQLFGHDQFAIGQRNGVAEMTTIITEALANGKVVVMLDAKNAFPSASREALIKQIVVTHTYLKPVIPLLQILLCNPHHMHLYQNNVLKTIFAATSGIPQGAMDASFLFTLLTRTLSYDPLSKEAPSEEVPRYRLLRYIDDFALICEPNSVDDAVLQLSRQARKLGLAIEHSKTKFLSRPSTPTTDVNTTYVKILGAFVQAKCVPSANELKKEQVMDFSRSCPFPAKFGEFKISTHCSWLVISKVSAMKLFYAYNASDPCLRKDFLQGSRQYIVGQIQQLLLSQPQFTISIAPLTVDNVALSRVRDGFSMPLYKDEKPTMIAIETAAASQSSSPNLSQRRKSAKEKDEPNKWEKSTIFHQAHLHQHITDAHFVLLLAFRLQLLLPRYTHTCVGVHNVKLSRNSTPEQVNHHILACASCSSHFFLRRHDEINRIICRYFHRIGISYSPDPPGLYKENPAPDHYHGKAGPDGLLVADRTYITDLAIVQANKEALSRKVAEKKRQYVKLLQRFPNLTLIPIVMSYPGVLCTSSRTDLLKFFYKHLQTFSSLIEEIHFRLMVNLGICIELWYVRSTSVWAAGIDAGNL